LRKGAAANNNAFIMRIGNHFLVEFGIVGKCWGYAESTIKPLLQPRQAGIGSISYYALRAAGHCVLVGRYGQRDGLSHRGDWETHFSESFEKLGVVPDHLSVKELVARYQLDVVDRRSEGGALWIRHAHDVGIVAERLRELSFTFKNSREGFYAASRAPIRQARGR
jgi:hypothetical protein